MARQVGGLCHDFYSPIIHDHSSLYHPTTSRNNKHDDDDPLGSVPPKEKFIPSPMQETTLTAPKPVKITQRSEDEISRASAPAHVDPPPLSPQRVHHAFYRPFVADSMDDRDMPAPYRGSIAYHSVDELTHSQFGTIKTVEKAKDKNSERMYKRPGFDNVPSY